MQHSIFFDKNVNPLELRGQLDYSGSNKSDWIRLHGSFSEKTMQNIRSETLSTLSVHIKI